MTKKETINAEVNTVEGEVKVKKESKIKSTYGKVVLFIAKNRGKIGLAVGLIAGAAGGVAVTKALDNRDYNDEVIEAECEIVESSESSEAL